MANVKQAAYENIDADTVMASNLLLWNNYLAAVRIVGVRYWMVQKANCPNHLSSFPNLIRDV